MKERAKEALHRGTKAVLIGGFFHVQHAGEFGLNEQASAWLYTEALAHQIDVLIVISNNTLAKRYRWATPEFAVKTINEAITDYEIQEGFTPGSISSFVFRRCAEMDSLSPQERVNGQHFCQSARKIKEFDPGADEELIVKKLGAVAREYFAIAVKMFE